MVVVLFGIRGNLEITRKFLHLNIDAPEIAVEVYGWTSVGVHEELPDHDSVLQETVVCHESIQLIVVPAEHLDMRFAQEREKFEVLGCVGLRGSTVGCWRKGKGKKTAPAVGREL
jgi:hypothetical protein